METHSRYKLSITNNEANEIVQSHVVVEATTAALLEAHFAAEETLVRLLLGHWVSGLDPAVARRNGTGEILGLCRADTKVGDKPWIMRVEDVLK